MVAAILIPMALTAGSVLESGVKMSEQGWRYFIPTWDGLADLVQFAAMLGLIGYGVLNAHVLESANEHLVIGAGVALFMFLGVVVPVLVASMEDRTGRKKVFKFAEVETSER